MEKKMLFYMLVYKAAKGNSNILVMNEFSVQVCEKGT